MKIIIIAVMLAVFVLPSIVLSFEDITKHTKIQKDDRTGYSATQTDYKARMSKQAQKKQKGGYYDGGYHNKSPNFKPNDLQFVKPGKNISHTKQKKN